MNRRGVLINAALLLCIAALSVALGCRVSDNYRKRAEQIDDYKLMKSIGYHEDKYDKQVPVEDMGYENGRWFRVTVLHTPGFRYGNNVIALSNPVTYYTKQGGRYVKAFTIERGTEVVWIDETLHKDLNIYYMEYGVYSYPTYEKGWRFAKPFKVAGEEGEWDDRFYYVKIGDLKSAARDIYRSDEVIRQHRDGMHENTESEFVRRIALMTDIVFSGGIYLSKDIMVDIWTAKEIALALTNSALIAVFFISLRAWRRKMSAGDRNACIHSNVMAMLWGLVIIPLFLAVADVGFRYHNQQQLNAQFKYKRIYSTENTYENGVPIEAIEFSKLKGAYVILDSVIPSGYYENISITVTLPITLNYYVKQGDRYVEAYSISKGSCIQWVDDKVQVLHLYHEIDYGIFTFPTYEKGWRYAKPFKIAGDEENSEDGFYYVRLSDIYTVTKKICDENKIFDYFAKMLYENRMYIYEPWPYARDIAETYIKTTDRVFYNNGTYLSKDFHGPLWTYRDTALVAVSALFFVAAMELRYR